MTTVGKGLIAFADYNRDCQICAERRAKNLAKVETQQEKHAETSLNSTIDIEGIIINLLLHLEKEGYAKDTIRGTAGALRALRQRGANLLDPETVKEALAKEQKWSPNRRKNVINYYTLFLKYNKVAWEKPRCKIQQKIPFIPTEAEIDALINGTGKKTATFLQVLKETAMRSGEAKRLHWTDVDFEKHLIRLNEPEKGSNPRIWKVSAKLIAMLNNLPRKSEKIFGNGPLGTIKATYINARRSLASKLQNPRLLAITFHTFRHWKATMLYHQTKDPYYVKDFLGHKSLDSTEIYINIERTMFESSSDEFTVKVTDKPEEMKTLLETGFEYVCQKDSLVFLRKRK
jgi:integrase